MAAGALAAQRQVPLLFTGAEGLSPDLEAYLRRSRIKRVVIVGAQSTINPAVTRRLQDLGLGTSRIAGGDSYGTAVAIAQQIRFQSTSQDDVVVLADSSAARAWPGAYASPLHSVRRNAPVLFTNGAELPSPTREYLEANGQEGVTQLVCLPGVAREACAVARELVGAR